MESKNIIIILIVIIVILAAAIGFMVLKPMHANRQKSKSQARYTLNGNNAARIFQVTNSNVTFKNIFFVNAKTTDNDASHGGAIRGPAENCIFINNSASRGGAISQCSAWNCIFVNNSAFNGGAAYVSHDTNCIVINNSAFNGGAISDGVARNCTFNYNHAKNYGGAMYSIYSRKRAFVFL